MNQKNIRMLIFIGLIVIAAIWIVLPNNPGIHIFGIDKDIETRLGLDLVGGVQALLEADLPAGTDIDPEAMKTAAKIVENRVNGLGVTEAVVQQAGDRRIVVELPGETDPEQALSTLKQTGLLEFVDFSDLTDQEVYSLQHQKIKTDYGQDETDSTNDSNTTEITTTNPLENKIFHTIMTGANLKNVQVVTNTTGEFQVSFELDSEGTKIFKDFTTNNVGKVLAIVLDKEVISTPQIQEPITDGKGVISGSFTAETSNALAIQLRYGSLPIPLTIVQAQIVGPTLGQDSLKKSLVAGLVGFIIVMLFMALYYRLPGIVADIVILIYALITFAIFRFIPVTLTLPGIAGFLLSTGSALDANILIFERMKEELRSGKPLKQSVKLGFQRAWPSIRDSNAATLITCVILFWFGSTFGATIVKGFSITLFIGVVVSLFTAVVVTRALLNFVLDLVKPTDLVKWIGL
jgi:preprotein translocase subunit SecD